MVLSAQVLPSSTYPSLQPRTFLHFFWQRMYHSLTLHSIYFSLFCLLNWNVGSPGAGMFVCFVPCRMPSAEPIAGAL